MTDAWPEDVRRPFRRHLSKVPEVTVLFWLVKILLTPVSEAIAEQCTALLGLGITTMLIATPLAVLLVVQAAVARHRPWLYWLIVLLACVFGILITDNLTEIFDVTPTAVTIAFAVLLVGVLGVWRAVERTLSIHTVDTPRREAFYWFAVLFALVLGVAATEAGLSGGGATALVAAATAAVWAAYRFLRLSGVLAFWIAYTLTFPLGAAIADRLARPAVTTAVSLVVIILVVGYLHPRFHDRLG